MTTDLRVISWNVHYPSFARDSQYCIDALEALGPFDVICLQEYVSGADSKLIDWLTGKGYQVAYMPFAHNLGYSQGVMTAVRPGLFASPVPKILREDGPRRFRPFYNVRGLMSTTIKVGASEVSINNVHLTYPRQHTIDMRRREFVSLQAFLKALSAQGPWLLCGDFNFIGLDKRRKYLKANYQHFTGDFWHKTWSHKGKFSPIRANLDYAFWDTGSKQMVTSTRLELVKGSDHHPIIMQVTL